MKVSRLENRDVVVKWRYKVPLIAPDKIDDHLKKLNYYRWQFLRRNSAYRSQYDQYKKQLVIQEVCLSRKKISAAKFEEWEEKSIGWFWDRWHIFRPQNYKVKNPQRLSLIALTPFSPVTECTGVLSEFGPCHIDSKVQNCRGRVRRYPSLIGLTINFEYPLTVVKPLVNRMIAEKYEMRKKFINRSNVDFAELDDLLRVWDFRRDNPGVSWSEVAEKLEPGKDAVIPKLRGRYARCEKFIGGGYVDVK